MKVQTQQSTFQPINILIETKEELQFFTALLGAITRNHMKAFGVKANPIYETLLEACNDETSAFSFTVILDEQVITAEDTEVDWLKVPRGTNILVRDHEREDWVERIFISYNQDDVYPYFCADSALDNDYQVGWKLAKLDL